MQKKVYHKPVLRNLGALSVITQKDGSSSVADAGSSPHRRV